MNAVGDSGRDLPDIKNDGRMYVYLSGNHFQQNKVIIPNNDNVINIYCVYETQPISSSRDTTFTMQNSLFGAMEITKNTDTSKYNYKGYGICFDEGGTFSHRITEGGFSHTTIGRNVIIFGADMSFSAHATNRGNNIYVLGDGLIQGINGTTIYVEKNCYRKFTDPGKKIVLSLHYNRDNSYLFVNGRQELKLKAKTDQLVKKKLCIGNLSDQWTASESEKTGLYGNIYDFLVDYQAVVGVGPIYDMHRYLMTKHNIKPKIYDTYYMKLWLIGLTISLFSIIKTKALECVSIVNQKCMARPKILDVNEGVGEALFYPYNVLVNKCSGSCNTLDNPIEKLCVPNVIKGLNMKVCNFLTMLNETRNVLWHESCKSVCKLNSSVCNNKQVWNDDTCRCDCNEDFGGIINCTKGYT